MSINFENPINDEAREMFEKMVIDGKIGRVDAMDGKTALISGMQKLNQQSMKDLANTAKQVVEVELNKIGDRKEVGGVVYELDEAGWRRLPIGTVASVSSAPVED
jgi:hypothetical protein